MASGGLAHQPAQRCQAVVADARGWGGNGQGRDGLGVFVKDRGGNAAQPDCLFLVINRITARAGLGANGVQLLRGGDAALGDGGQP